ncbi:class I SAM-dependent methyltransferase [Spiractinospora alimapuensis]|uniref:class I SAM-dependent methyltransferase n=1 Tax=Spiractinospora alimapuensis TaxID=2820884 RepID=UPI001F18C20B|nr:class I SAM-dependent methyltransferase [Spiractinospora alimapuensis]
MCDSPLLEFLDLGRQPLSDHFRAPEDTGAEFFFHLSVGRCEGCGMVQLMEEVPRERMFHADYPYLSSGSAVMRQHFAEFANRAPTHSSDPFVVELGCNDGVMLRRLAERGVRHLGVEPSGGVADLARAAGVEVWNVFFDEETAAGILRDRGPADVVYAANTLCHIPYVVPVLRGVRELLAPGGVLVFEDPYFGDIVRQSSFDQIYDEHFYLFTGNAVHNLAARCGLELVDVERLGVHGGEVRYTLGRSGEHSPSPAVSALLREERERGLTEPAGLRAFAERVDRIRADLVSLLTRLRDEGARVAGYGATAKSATVLNYCGIGPDLVEYISDTTPAKQARLTPGSGIEVRPPETFTLDYPDYAVLFAWNHAEEIIGKEQGFRDSGGQWIRYVPEVHMS